METIKMHRIENVETLEIFEQPVETISKQDFIAKVASWFDNSTNLIYKGIFEYPIPEVQ